MLLEKLRDEINRCDGMVRLIGDRSGEDPTVEHAAALGTIPEYDA